MLINKKTSLFELIHFRDVFLLFKSYQEPPPPPPEPPPDEPPPDERPEVELLRDGDDDIS